MPAVLSPSSNPLQSTGGGGVLITPLSFLVGYKIEGDGRGGIHIGHSEELRNFCLTCKDMYRMVKSRRARVRAGAKAEMERSDSACNSNQITNNLN